MSSLLRRLGGTRPALPEPPAPEPPEPEPPEPVAEPAAAPAGGPFQGYVDERSTHHVAGWVRDLSDAGVRVAFEVVDDHPTGERILARGIADQFSEILPKVGVGNGTYALTVMFEPPVTASVRDRLFVRVAGHAHRLELAPELRTEFTPIAHLAMDIVNNCNLRCPFCVYDYSGTRDTQIMSDETFEQALRLIPFIRDANFWLSCLHEATLHPRLTQFIERVPAEYRRKVFYTTNLAKPMPETFFDFIANSGLHHINVSLESQDPALYERMRKGARHRIFVANWDKLLASFRAARRPPKLYYNIMAYRSNLAELPGLVETLRRDKLADYVEVRHTFDFVHIPDEFRKSEFLDTADWAALQELLSIYPASEVLLIPPPGGVAYLSPEAFESAQIAPAPPPAPKPRIRRPINLGMSWDGTLRAYGEEPQPPGWPPIVTDFVTTNINYLSDPVRFVLAL